MTKKQELFFYILIIICLVTASCSQSQMKHIGEEYTGSQIRVSKENRFFLYTVQFCNIDKTSFVAFFNKDTLDIGQGQSTWCFDSLGRPIQFVNCISSYCDNLNDLVEDNVSIKSPITIERSKGCSKKNSVKLKYNYNLENFLEKNDIRLLDNSRLTIKKLPKSKYYLFVDWYWVYPEEGYGVLAKMDSICAQNPYITFVKVHNTNIKGTPVVLN